MDHDKVVSFPLFASVEIDPLFFARGHMIKEPKSIPDSIDDSLEWLGVPIDLYLIHVSLANLAN
jgi:diketogulonate reductase-like aldo/keto reductase